MPSAGSFAVIAAASLAAVLLAELTKRWRLPVVVFEVVLGILIGPQVLDWAEISPFINGVANFGLAFLMFMAGYEIDLHRLRGAPLDRAVISWFVSLGLALCVGAVLIIEGFDISDLLIGLVLTTTAMGALVPILNDAGQTRRPFGAFALAAGAIGEFGPIVAIAVLLAGDNPLIEALWLAAFVLAALALAFVATRPQPRQVDALLIRQTTTYGQLPVRLAVLLLAAMLLLASDLGLEGLLGSFTAGMLFRPLLSLEQRERAEPRLNALGFGFVIPFFFVVSGMRFDLDALTGDVGTMAKVPLYFALMLAVRGLPALFIYRGVLPAAQRRALAFLQATALPLVVVITEIGRQTDRMTASDAAALVGAAMLSMLVFPALGLAQLRRDEADPDPEPAPNLDR
ncbi:MAG: cation:proton antiporter [Acidimicrobiia bacterium]